MKFRFTLSRSVIFNFAEISLGIRSTSVENLANAKLLLLSR